MFCKYLSKFNVWRQRKDRWFDRLASCLACSFCQEFARKRAEKWRQEATDALSEWATSEKERLSLNKLIDHDVTITYDQFRK